MIRAFLTVSTGTLASRLLGFVRDSMIAALLGAGPFADAFLAAFQLVNVIRRWLTEGALNAALIPSWLRLHEGNGAMVAAAFAGRVLGTLSAALLVAAALIGVLMPLLIAALAPGFAAHPTLQLAVKDARLMLPYLAFAAPVAVMMALMNAQHRFVLSAFSPLLFNIGLIAVMIVLFGWPHDAASAALTLAAAVGIAGLLQLAILLIGGGLSIAKPVRISFDAEMRAFLGSAARGMTASSAPQLLVIAGAVIAASSPGALTWLYFASRLIELPLGIIAVAISAVLMPQMTRALSAADGATVARAQSRGLELAAGLALPATLGLIVLNAPIVRMLFEHGRFTAADAAATAQMLTWLALGLPAHVVFKTLSPAFFARHDTFTPLAAMLIGLAVTIVLGVIIGRISGPESTAVAIACGAWTSALALTWRGAVTFGFSVDAAARQRMPRIAAAALAMGALLWLGAGLVPWPNLHGVTQGAVLLVAIAAAAAIYGLLLALFGVTNWTGAVNAVRQTATHDLRDEGPRGI